MQQNFEVIRNEQISLTVHNYNKKKRSLMARIASIFGGRKESKAESMVSSVHVTAEVTATIGKNHHEFEKELDFGLKGHWIADVLVESAESSLDDDTITPPRFIVLSTSRNAATNRTSLYSTVAFESPQTRRLQIVSMDCIGVGDDATYDVTGRIHGGYRVAVTTTDKARGSTTIGFALLFTGEAISTKLFAPVKSKNAPASTIGIPKHVLEDLQGRTIVEETVIQIEEGLDTFVLPADIKEVQWVVATAVIPKILLLSGQIPERYQDTNRTEVLVRVVRTNGVVTFHSVGTYYDLKEGTAKQYTGLDGKPMLMISGGCSVCLTLTGLKFED